MLGVTTGYTLERSCSALQDEPVLLLVRPHRLKSCGEEVLAFGGPPVVPPPLHEISGLERRKPFFSAVVCSDPEVRAAYLRQWGEFSGVQVLDGEDEIALVRDLARQRVRERLFDLEIAGVPEPDERMEK
jgi:hypothetical protein